MLKQIRRVFIVSRRAFCTNDVQFETYNDAGIITLNRANNLNAINHYMFRSIYNVMKEWEADKRLVIIKASGDRAFSAGGDLIEFLRCDPEERDVIAKAEYNVNGLIGEYKLPFIALLKGITMGGGAGVSIHGKYRIATESTIFAMPENAVGFYPDVGSCYFLRHLPGKLGLYLALTGCKILAHDVVNAGIATHFIRSEDLNNLVNDLINKENCIEETINSYSVDIKSKQSDLLQHLNDIDECFSATTVEEIVKNLSRKNNSWARITLQHLNKNSPTSLKLTLKLHQITSQANLKDCLAMNYRLTQKCSRHLEFFEGIRAMLVDKDYKPKWSPAKLEDVNTQLIDAYFMPLSDSSKELWYECA